MTSDWQEVIGPHAFDGKLPARVPVTYNFGPKIGEADVSLKEQDYFLTVKVRAYGGVTDEEAAQALRDYPVSIDIPGQRELEILDAQVLRIEPGP